MRYAMRDAVILVVDAVMKSAAPMRLLSLLVWASDVSSRCSTMKEIIAVR